MLTVKRIAWIALLPAALVLSAMSSAGCATSAGRGSSSTVLRESEVVWIVERSEAGIYRLQDSRGDSIPIGGNPRVEDVRGWYLLSPGTLAKLYRDTTTDT